MITKRFKNVFKEEKPVIAVIHVDPLPGTPSFKGNVKPIIEKVVKESEVYYSSGVDSIIIENMHDVPYIKGKAGPEITSIMSIIGYEVKNKTGLPCGIQILAGANIEALAAANSAGLDFMRAEGFVFAHVADEGIIESSAGELLRYRKNIYADEILVFTDIKKKHSSHSITSDTDIVETASAAEFFLSDGIILTGKSTGEEADINEISAVSKSVSIPVLIGSGITSENVEKFFTAADGFIIGSAFKRGGKWLNSPDRKKIAGIINKINNLRSGLS
jgi:hypothetical protein